ncbi:MAG: S8 family serine peptidase [Acidobacteriota bacterium]|nr:S8 family serine peptidase [Acidobacteriota bacterium]
MPEVKFGTKDEPAVSFRKSDDLIAVRTRSNRSLREGPVLSSAAAAVQDSEMVLAFPEVGVEVYKIPPPAAAGVAEKSLVERKEALRAAPDIRFAGGVLVDEQSGEPVVYTENLFIKFVDGADPEECRAVIREANLTIKREVDYAANAFFLAAPEDTGTEVFDIAAKLLKREDVEFCHPEIVRQRGFKAIPAQQWHLKTTSINGTIVSASVNAEAAHLITLGQGITIAVIDDGVDIDHDEFNSASKIVAPRDATLGTNDPRPKDPSPFGPENHGTACAGVACADGRNGASGVAPKAKLLPIRLSSGLGSQQEADAFRWAADNGADVISCSWGPRDGAWFRPNDPLHNQIVQIPASTRLAIDYATTNGRGGKGCVILFAAGNGNESVDNDGYASYQKVIAVAACNDRGKRSVYSDFGAAVWCSFPSRDFGHPPFNHPEPLTTGIWTTDRRGTRGYNNGNVQDGDQTGNYTNSFGGTSSSCPGAAGIAALILSVNPNLRWQEVREVMRQSGDRIDPQGGAYDAGGRSKLYGFGRLNAEKAVTLALPLPRNSISVSRDFNLSLPDLQTVTATIAVSESQPVDDLTVEVDIKHTFIGDLVLTLIPPAATSPRKIVLHNRAGGSNQNIKRTFDALTTPELTSLKGKKANGIWELEIQDKEARDQGTLVKFGLKLTFPQAVPPSPAGGNRNSRGSSKPQAKRRTASKNAKKGDKKLGKISK